MSYYGGGGGGDRYGGGGGGDRYGGGGDRYGGGGGGYGGGGYRDTNKRDRDSRDDRGSYRDQRPRQDYGSSRGRGDNTCNQWQQTGTCRFGQDCRFSHDGPPGQGRGGGGGGGRDYGGGRDERPSSSSTSSYGGRGGYGGGGRGGYGGDRGGGGGDRRGSEQGTTELTAYEPSDSGSSAGGFSIDSSEMDKYVKEQDDLRSVFSRMSIEPPLTAAEVARKKSGGTVGTRTTLVSNHFPLVFKMEQMNLYIVEFNPPIDTEDTVQRSFVYRLFRQQIKAVYGTDYGWNNTNFMAANHVPHQRLETADGQRQLIITFKRTIDTSVGGGDQEISMVQNSITRQLLRTIDVIEIGRNYYFPRKYPLMAQLNILRGFNAAVFEAEKTQLVVDLRARVVDAVTARKLLDDIDRAVTGQARQQRWDNKQYSNELARRADEAFKGKVVWAEYGNRAYRISRVDFKKKPSDTFERKDGTQVSYADYILQTYGDKVKHIRSRDKPGMLVHEARKRGGERGEKELLYFIPELCTPTGMTEQQRADNSLMKEFARYTRMDADKRFSMTLDIVRQVTGNSGRKYQDLPMQLAERPDSINARIFGNFPIMFGRTSRDIQLSGKFDKHVRDNGFVGDTPEISRWVIVHDERDQRLADDVNRQMCKIGRDQRANFRDARLMPVRGSRADDFKRAFEAIGQDREKPQVVVCLVPRGDQLVYSCLKYYMTTQYGIVSQAMDTSKLMGGKNVTPIIGNTMAQICAKLGYLPWGINFKANTRIDWLGDTSNPKAKTTTMIIGADVCHDTKSRQSYGPYEGGKSCVAFAASYDSMFTHYNSWISLQFKRDSKRQAQEHILQAKELMTRALQGFKQHNGQYPEHIVIYRDGVGDSQINKFVRVEIADYQKAFAELGCSPKLTVVVIQKSISTRLFAECPKHRNPSAQCDAGTFREPCDGRAQYHSPKPGTVVDNTITSTLLREFYLVPSIAPKGATARPGRFIVVQDDHDLSDDALQILTNQMCCLYFNWQGPIRSPAPAMYAHKLAYLCGTIVNGEPHERISDKLHFL